MCCLGTKNSQKWMCFLEGSYIVWRLHSFSDTVQEQMQGLCLSFYIPVYLHKPKLWFYETGHFVMVKYLKFVNMTPWCYTLFHCAVPVDAQAVTVWPPGCLQWHSFSASGQEHVPSYPVLHQLSGGHLSHGQVHCLPLQWQACLVSAISVFDDSKVKDFIVLVWDKETSVKCQIYHIARWLIIYLKFNFTMMFVSSSPFYLVWKK